MAFTNRELFNILRDFMTDEEIFRGCEFSQERFMENLERDENGLRDQSNIKQRHMLFSLIPIRTLDDAIKAQKCESTSRLLDAFLSF